MTNNDGRNDADRMAEAARSTPQQRRPPDLSKPSPARMYDYFLGGRDNFAVDRAAADKVIEIGPETPALMRNNRRFVLRATKYLAEHGIDQFIDLGAGIPATPNVHEVARELRPDARIVYVDNDPVVAAHTRALRAADPGITVVEADIREVTNLPADGPIAATIDFARPVGVLACATLHFIDDAALDHLLGWFRTVSPAGSFLAISTVWSESLPEHVEADGERVYAASTSGGLWPRDRSRIARMFDGYDLVDPGIVDVARWRSDDEPTRFSMLAGVGRRR